MHLKVCSQTSSGVRLCHRCRLNSFVEADNGVTATLVNLETGARETVEKKSRLTD